LFRPDAQLPYYAALDVSDLATIMLSDQASRPPARGGVRRAIYEATAATGEPFIAIAVALHHSPAGTVAYARLHGQRRGYNKNVNVLPHHLGKAVIVSED
jgi:hypothetical protein